MVQASGPDEAERRRAQDDKVPTPPERVNQRPSHRASRTSPRDTLLDPLMGSASSLSPGSVDPIHDLPSLM